MASAAPSTCCGQTPTMPPNPSHPPPILLDVLTLVPGCGVEKSRAGSMRGRSGTRPPGRGMCVRGLVHPFVATKIHNSNSNNLLNNILEKINPSPYICTGGVQLFFFYRPLGCTLILNPFSGFLCGEVGIPLHWNATLGIPYVVKYSPIASQLSNKTLK